MYKSIATIMRELAVRGTLFLWGFRHSGKVLNRCEILQITSKPNAKMSKGQAVTSPLLDIHLPQSGKERSNGFLNQGNM